MVEIRRSLDTIDANIDANIWVNSKTYKIFESAANIFEDFWNWVNCQTISTACIKQSTLRSKRRDNKQLYLEVEYSYNIWETYPDIDQECLEGLISISSYIPTSKKLFKNV